MSKNSPTTIEVYYVNNLSENQKKYYPFLGAGYIQLTHDYTQGYFAKTFDDKKLENMIEGLKVKKGLYQSGNLKSIHPIR